MPNFLVRSSTIADADDVRRLRLEALQDTPDAFGDSYAIASQHDEQYWRDMASNPSLFLCEADGEVIGMLKGDIHTGNGRHWMFSMLVTPRYRGTPAASLLVDRVVQWAREDGARTLSLYVTTTVTRARSFYAKKGFVETGEVITMDRDPRLSLVAMELALD